MGRWWHREHYRRTSGDATGVEEPETGKSLPANYPSATRFDDLSSAASDSDTLAAGDGSFDAQPRKDCIMVTLESSDGRTIRARSLDSGVRTLYGRHAVVMWSPGEKITNRRTRYLVIDQRRRYGAHNVLGSVIVTQ